MINGDNRISGAASRVLDGFLSLDLLTVAVVVLIMTVIMPVFIVVVFIVVALIVVALIMVVLVMVVLWEGHVVCRIVAVEFLSILGVFGKDVHIGRTRTVERGAKLADEQRFVVKRGFSARHGVGACNQRAISR